MAIVNRTKKEINAKLVFYGPASGGKKTNLEYIYKKLKPECRGKMKSVATQKDRMIFFDFMPAELADVNGYSVRFHVYTISGEVTQPAIWKMVLKGVDGLVFVADSNPDRMSANIDSMKSLTEHLNNYGKILADFPSVIQCNKQDLANATPIQDMQRMMGIEEVPLVSAKAKKGEGVVNSLNKVIKGVLQNLKETEPSLKEEPAATKTAAATAPAAPPTKAPSAGLKGDSFDELASFTLAQAAETGGMTGETAFAAAPAMHAEPTIEVVGEVEMVGDGRFRLPIAVMYGGKKKEFAISLSLSVEELLR